MASGLGSVLFDSRSHTHPRVDFAKEHPHRLFPQHGLPVHSFRIHDHWNRESELWVEKGIKWIKK